MDVKAFSLLAYFPTKLMMYLYQANVHRYKIKDTKKFKSKRVKERLLMV